MRKLLIGLLALTSLSSFASVGIYSDFCTNSAEKYIKLANLVNVSNIKFDDNSGYDTNYAYSEGYSLELEVLYSNDQLKKKLLVGDKLEKLVREYCKD